MTVGMLLAFGLGFLAGMLVTLRAVRRTIRQPGRTLGLLIVDDGAANADPRAFYRQRLADMRQEYDEEQAHNLTQGRSW